MHNADGSFTWSAWDQNKWDHYHHAGVQVRAYRTCPFRVVSTPPRSRWHWLFVLLGVR